MTAIDSDDKPTRAGLRLADRIGLWILTGLGSLATAILALLSILNLTRVGSNSAVPFTLPIDLTLPASATAGSATIQHYSTEVDAVGSGFGPDTVALAFTGALLQWISALTVSVIIVLFLVAMLRSKPFTTNLRRALFWSGIAVIALGAVGSVATALATSTAATELSGSPEGTPYGLGSVGDTTTLIVGLALLVASALVRIGERMQRDTEGLV